MIIVFKPFKDWSFSVNIQKLISYLTGGTLCLRYKDKPINAVYENNHSLL
jgi:hypothetical protein